MTSVQDQAQKLIDTLALYDERMADVVAKVPDAVELTKSGLAEEEDVIQVAAENIVFATTMTSSNLELLELAFDVELDSQEDLVNLPGLNRALLESFVTRREQARHLSQLLATIYSRVVEPLDKDHNGDFIKPAIRPSEAVDKILQAFQGGPKVVEATMHGEFVVDL